MDNTMDNTSPTEHNLGPMCRMAPVSPPVVSDADHDEVPPLHAQFFYSSLIPIDDPFSSGAITGVSDAKLSKGNLRPFSPGDNNALQKAWFNLISDADRQAHRQALVKPSSLEQPQTSKAVAAKLALVVRHLALKHKNKHGKLHPQDTAAPDLDDDQPVTPMATCCAELYMDVANELHLSFCSLVRERDPTLGVESVMQEVMMELRRLRLASEKKPTTEGPPPPKLSSSPGFPFDLPFSPRRTASGTSTPRLYDPEDRDMAKGRSGGIEIKNSRVRSGSGAVPFSTVQASSSVPVRIPPMGDGISGRPFVRVGSLEASPSPRQVSSPVPSPVPERPDDKKPEKNIEDEEALDTVMRFDDIIADTRAGSEYGKDATRDVAVGLSRLHMVSLPILQMKPIYWSPVNDLAIVSRATWFYRDTMLPIPAVVANQLEAGYKELRPYSQSWNDELKCAVDIGPAGEEKVSHRLWPKDPERVDSASAAHAISNDQYCAARCFRGEAAAEGSAELPRLNQDGNQPTVTTALPFAQYHVIYKNAAEAFLLKPSLKPSAYYGRRPVYRITKGLTVGIPVCRGFDRKAWDRLYDKKSTAKAAEAEQPATEFSQLAAEQAAQESCPACKANNNKGQVTDLVLVAHGIGQKFAERVESFHFTHAINAFRRSVNLELRKPAVKHVLREGQNGIMVLPINWRHALSFEDGGPMREEDKTSHRPEGFGLKDIEPPTIKAVRSLISDIMFDIPFYMSHHKGKMIQALVAEANRVYRLWCRNNPGFRQNGKVHIIAHSLGSAMALEILSKQPNIPPPMNLNIDVSKTKHFEFDTKNLFFVGSPAGFFLLLERGALIPRRGRHKPGANDGDVDSKSVTADAGTFGCLAVDNIYNVVAKEDPIAYFLNGTIDPAYAASLKTAYVPSTAVSLFKSMGDAVRGILPGTAAAPTTGEHEAEAPIKQPLPMRLPSQLELEVHDFSREEVAETKAFLLNDNGQIDYFLRSGGGPLEIQYLNMLSAHSSYWTSNDFIRMLCTEVGRAPGRENTLAAMRAVKATKRMVPDPN